MREKAAFRDQLEDIIAFTGGARMLTARAVADYTGHSTKWVARNLDIRQSVTAVVLAHRLLDYCEEDGR